MNLRSWYKGKALMLSVLVICLETVLCACQSNPQKPIIASKNDGVFTEIIQDTSNENDDPTLNVSTHIFRSETFFSTDQSVKFNYNFDQTLIARAMPVIEIIPHNLTIDDAKRVASVLFGDTEFYEVDPLLAPQYTKQEIQENINRWSYYTSSSAISELLGNNDEFTIERLKAKIEELNTLYETAPDETNRVPCQWTFFKDSTYIYSPQELSTIDTSYDNEAIMATCKINDIGYQYDVVTRNKADYKLNMISAYFDASKSPLSIDNNIYRAALTRTPSPTEEQIAAVKSTAKDMLQQMNLGEWMIDQCYVRTLGENILEHVICVNAVPVLNDVAVIRQPQLTALNSNDVYSSNYYMTDVSFEFSANGDLIKFTMYSPIDINQVVNKNVHTIDINTLLEKAKQHLTLTDSYQFGLQNGSEYLLKESLETSVEICKLNYGLLRIKVPYTDDSYYYVPGLVLYGTVENTGSESKQLYFKSEEPFPIIALNAVDGTIIALSNE